MLEKIGNIAYHISNDKETQKCLKYHCFME